MYLSTNSLLDQFLPRPTPVQCSRSIQPIQTVPWPKHFFFSIFREDQSLLQQTKKLRKRMCLVDQLPIGSVLTPAISCTKFKIHLAHADSLMAKTCFFKPFERASLCFTDQETQEENVLGRPTPFWASSYTSYLLYKVQDPFRPCRQSHGQNIFF